MGIEPLSLNNVAVLEIWRRKVILVPKHRTVTAGQLMASQFESVSSEDDVHGVSQLLVASGLPSLPVRDDDGALVGVLTARAVLAALATGSSAPADPVGRLMDRDPAVVADYAPIEWILVEMDDAHLWTLPVVNDANRLIGVVSLPNMARFLSPSLLSSTWANIVAHRAE